jgi:ubiquinone/menaquinone biosynthesis C-methylase UbiE
MTQQDDDNVYFVDHENAAEMVRLINQDRALTKGIGGFFPREFDPSTARSILDLGCGPGGWVQEVAFAYPEIEVTGMDISEIMISYAKAQAKVQGLDNAHFCVGDLLNPLAFPDASFDLVNARLIAFLPTDVWPILMQECLRVLRPGGMCVLTEMEWITNSPAVEQLFSTFTSALKAVGQSFSPDGRLIGITPMLGKFLNDAGFQNVHLTPHLLDISAGAEAAPFIYENWKTFYKVLQPFLVAAGVATQEKLDQAYEQMLIEVPQDTFRGLIFMVSAAGKKQ